MNILAGRERNIYEVECYNSLIEAPVEFVITIFVFPRGESRAAAHNRETVALF